MLGLATVNLCTKFEISTFTQYKDVKGDEKLKKMGGLGGWGHRKQRHLIEHM